MSLLEQLRAELVRFDGKAVSLLSETAARHKANKSFFNDLLTLCADKSPAVADGATWILKAHIDDGGVLTRKETARLVSAAPKTSSWPAQLHICQVIGKLELTASQAQALAKWLKPLLKHERPFLRAWSVDALCAVAVADKALKAIADRALKAAQNDSAASVRARAGNIERNR